MQVSSVHSIPMKGSVVNNAAAANPQEKKDVKEIIKDNKGKIALALGALAAAGVAAVALTRGKKVNGISQDAVRNISENKNVSLLNKVENLRDITQNSDRVEVQVFKKGLKQGAENTQPIALKETISKHAGTVDGKDVIVECKVVSGDMLHNYGNMGAFKFLRDAKTNEILEVERTTNPGDLFHKGGVFKKVEKSIDENGNNVITTLKNNIPYSKQTTVLNKDGSRDIIVEYFDEGSEGYKKVINIAKDGKRKESEIGERFISL